MEKLTKAQARLLKRFSAVPGASLSIHAEHRGYCEPPIFHGQFNQPPCPTCGLSSREGMDWRVIQALADSGMIREAVKGSDTFSMITPAGRAALAKEQRE
jgi:hypothetical protein